MTVNGNVALGGSSLSLFAITPSGADTLVVNGNLSIATGATLQLVAADAVTPGKTINLITASGGITGSYSNVIKPDSVFGFLVQQADSIELVGQFSTDPNFSPPVRRGIDYVNTLLASGQASADLLAAVPILANSSGGSDPGRFAQITPEAYAAASQVVVEDGLALADAGRGHGFTAPPGTVGLFTFGSGLANTRTLGADGDRGTEKARINSYGVVGGIGWAGQSWSIGGFGGYLTNHQNIGSLGATTKADGALAGLHGQWSNGNIGVNATVAYTGGTADTRRSLPDGNASGHYNLHGWVADLRINDAIEVSPNWKVEPSVGATTIRSTRGTVDETGGDAFALGVSRDSDSALFVDGALTFSGGQMADAPIQPYLSLGLRYQAEGRVPHAIGNLDGGAAAGFFADGASRAPLLATATVGADATLSKRLALFGAITGESGDDDRRIGAQAGFRLAF